MPILTPEERIGTLLAEKYQLTAILGRGGMGAVLGGVHVWTGRPVAVKLLNHEYAHEPDIITRFLQEARTAAGLKHPNVVDVLDMGQLPDGTVYLVLERLDGEALSALLTEHGALTPSRAREILLPVMHAVTYAHFKNVVHRDIKPENIFISQDLAGGIVPKLLDFGIAKVLNGKRSGTRTGRMLGTLEYMSPEQVRGASTIGPATDIWSMGVVWYQCLCGVLPFQTHNSTQSGTALLLEILSSRPEPLLKRVPTLPSAIAAAIDRALEADPSQRHPSMEAFAAVIAAAEIGPESECVPAYVLSAAKAALVPTALSPMPGQEPVFAFGAPKPVNGQGSAPRPAVNSKIPGESLTSVAWAVNEAPAQRHWLIAAAVVVTMFGILGGLMAFWLQWSGSRLPRTVAGAPWMRQILGERSHASVAPAPPVQLSVPGPGPSPTSGPAAVPDPTQAQAQAPDPVAALVPEPSQIPAQEPLKLPAPAPVVANVAPDPNAVPIPENEPSAPSEPILTANISTEPVREVPRRDRAKRNARRAPEPEIEPPVFIPAFPVPAREPPRPAEPPVIIAPTAPPPAPSNPHPIVVAPAPPPPASSNPHPLLDPNAPLTDYE